MEIIVSPGYSNFFNDEVPQIDELLHNIPSKTVIAYCSLINSEIYNNEQDFEKQLSLLNFVTITFPENLKESIYKKFVSYKKDGKTIVNIFSKRFTLEFIHYVLLRFENLEFTQPSTEIELRIFKAYLIVIETITKDNTLSSALPKANGNRTTFREILWPYIAKQFEINHAISPHFEIFKCILFLKYISEETTFNKYLITYLNERGCSSFIEYISILLNIILQSTQIKESKSIFKSFNFLIPKKNDLILESLSINIEDYKDKYRHHHLNFKGLKQKPIFKYDNNHYIPLNIYFLYKKLYTGVVFDFYYSSGIKDEVKFKSFDLFKTHYSSEFSEKILFKYLIQKSFNSKHSVIRFSDDINQPGQPDCYIREGKNIYLIEFKDYFFGDQAASSGNYDSIKNEIDKKFIKNQDGKPKGISQLSKIIKKLSIVPYEFDDYTKKGIKATSLNIYPIIIHTDAFYQIADINDYLDNELKLLLSKEVLFTDNRYSCVQNSFKLKNLYLIELQTMFRFYKFFENKSLQLNVLIDRVDKIKKDRTSKYNRFGSGSYYLKASACFEDILLVLNIEEFNFSDPKWIKSFLIDLGMKETTS